MKHVIHAATTCVLIAAGTAVTQPTIAERAHPVMVINRDSSASEKLRRSTASCVELTQAERFEEAKTHCNLAIRYAESGSSGAGPNVALMSAAARSNRAVLSWLMGQDERAAADLAVAALQAPEASFVRTNLAVMGREPPATPLAGGAND
jgi:hypothetical protein